MAVTEAHKRASRKWDSARDNIMIRPDKETGAAIRAAAAAAGQSNQQYILQATLARMDGEELIDREKIEQHIEKTGESVNQFVNRAVDQTIKNDLESVKE